MNDNVKIIKKIQKETGYTQEDINLILSKYFEILENTLLDKRIESTSLWNLGLLQVKPHKYKSGFTINSGSYYKLSLITSKQFKNKMKKLQK